MSRQELPYWRCAPFVVAVTTMCNGDVDPSGSDCIQRSYCPSVRANVDAVAGTSSGGFFKCYGSSEHINACNTECQSRGSLFP